MPESSNGLLLVLISTVLVMLIGFGVALYFQRRTQTAEDWAMGGRSLPTYVIVFTQFATLVGGGVLELTQGRSDITVSRVLLRSPKAGLPESAVTFDVNDILNDDAIDTVVEVGIPNELKMSSNTMSVTITAR